MVKRDTNGHDSTLGSVRDTDCGKPAEPDRTQDRGDDADLHEAHYRPEMGTIVPTDDRLRTDRQ